MMKFAPAINVSLGALLALPVLAGRDEGGLLQAIEAGNLALEQLAGVQRGLEQGDMRSISDLLSLTEPPVASGPEQNDLLTTLRAQVSRLQMKSDQVESGTATPPSETGEAWAQGEIRIQRGPGGLRISNGPSPTPSGRSGLDGSLLMELGAGRPKAGSIAQGSRKKQAFESGEDFVANPLGMGRLLCKAKDYEAALEVLEPLSEPEAQYWSAVCLERLGRDHEAIVRYEFVIGLENAGPFAASAKNDLAFLKWKREYFERRAGREQK